MEGSAVTQRFGALLDEAVSDLEPRSSDPVRDVVTRRRVARRRGLTVGILAVAVVIGGGVAVGDRLAANRDAVPAAGIVGEPPVPQVVGNNVVAGDLILPIPNGWRVLPASVPADCAKGTNFEKTILIGGSRDGGCAFAPIEVRSIPDSNPMGIGAERVIGNLIHTSPITYTLRGGEPAWLTTAVDDPMNSPAKRATYPDFNYYNNLVVPWSRVLVTLRVPGPEQQRIIDTMRTAPHTRSGRLALPATAAKATLTVPDATGGYSAAGYRATTDPATIAAVLRLLREQTSVVDYAHACAGPDQRAASLSLDHTAVVISLRGRCQEVVSSDGGRVRLTDSVLSKLLHTFGVAGQ
jgi:hypothetical protein